MIVKNNYTVFLEDIGVNVQNQYNQQQIICQNNNPQQQGSMLNMQQNIHQQELNINQQNNFPQQQQGKAIHSQRF